MAPRPFRLWPRSLLGQVVMAVALALFVAQGLSALLLINAAQSRRDAQTISAAAFQLVRNASPRADTGDRASIRERRRARGDRAGAGDRPRRELRRDRLPRSIRLTWSDAPPTVLAGENRDTDAEHQLAEVLQSQGVGIADLRVIERAIGEDPLIASRPRLVRRIESEGRQDQFMLVAALRREGAQQWAIARVVNPPVQRAVRGTILLQTAFIFLVLTGLLGLLIRRITRPLGELAQRTERFSGVVADGEPMPEHGPEDMRRLIRAHNRMEARITALLDEKDVMLGAIGHDLKTPLAALRVRVENVADEDERARMAAGIEDITRTLDDILSLARVGRAGDPPEKTSLSALAASVVEEFEDLAQPVDYVESGRVVATVHLIWLKRALRNLITNAVRYGGGARVSVAGQNGSVVLAVEDDGPGIPDRRIADMLEPFARGEASRNRATGGAGLGLTLARAIAEQHGGSLVLANRPEGGLRAELRLPKHA